MSYFTYVPCFEGLFLIIHSSKRAKTEAEKEQRRIERVLRNRAAAQSSRERKRKEVQALEDQKALLEENNDLLKSRLTIAEQQNQALGQQLKEMEEKISHYENYMRVARQVAAAVEKESVHPTPADEPVPIKEEDPFIFVHSEDASIQDSTLDPNSLFSDSPSDNPSQSPEATESLSMTHQSAALMCDLQCLQRDPTPESWTRLCGGWMSLLLAWFLRASISTPTTLIPIFLNLLDLQSNLLQASLSNLSSISNRLNSQFLQRLQTCSRALAHHSQVATGSALRLESAKNVAVQSCSGSSSDSDESRENPATRSEGTGEASRSGWYVDGSEFMNLLGWENG